MGHERAFITDPFTLEQAEVVGRALRVAASGSDTPSYDAFGRERSSGTGQRFDVEFIYDEQPDLIDAVIAGAGTIVHQANERDLLLAINGAALADAAEVFSHYDVPYTAGNSQLIDITGSLNPANITGGNAEIFFRSSISGSVVETVIDQAAWNLNTCQDADWQYSQILMMDFQSLKVGRIRFNLVRSGIPVPIHEIVNDNIRVSGYWRSPTLPAMWRVYNDATYTYLEMGYGDADDGIGLRYRVPVNAGAQMRAICATVKSEGGLSIFDLPGFRRSVSSNITPVTVSTTLIPLLSISPRATFQGFDNRGVYIPDAFTIQTDNPVRIDIYYRPVLTNASFVNVDATNSGLEYDVSATALAGGILVDSEYIGAGNNARTVLQGLIGRTLLSLGRTATPDILTIAGIRTSTNDADVYTSLKWKEIR